MFRSCLKLSKSLGFFNKFPHDCWEPSELVPARWLGTMIANHRSTQCLTSALLQVAKLAESFLTEDLSEETFSSPKAGHGMWASQIRILNPIKQVHTIFQRSCAFSRSPKTKTKLFSLIKVYRIPRFPESPSTIFLLTNTKIIHF